MRCALYCRVSTTDQNCEMQLRELREYISRRDWKNGGEYFDTGFSGAKASRPALDKLMADAVKRKFDCAFDGLLVSHAVEDLRERGGVGSSAGPSAIRKAYAG